MNNLFLYPVRRADKTVQGNHLWHQIGIRETGTRKIVIPETGKFINLAKQELKAQSQPECAFEIARNTVPKAVEEIKDLQAKGEAVVPELSYEAINNGTVSKIDISKIRQRGCLIARNVVHHIQAEKWNEELATTLIAITIWNMRIRKRVLIPAW